MENAKGPIIGVTLGEAAGIGPELIVKALSDENIRNLATWVIADDTGVGPIGNDELNARLFMKEAGVEMTYVPAEGAGPMHSSLLGGHVDVMLEEIGPTLSYIEKGDIVPLVIFAEERLEDFPDIPTTVEKGWDLTTGVERCLMINADASSEIVDKLEESAKKAIETEEYQEYEEKSNLHYRDGWMGSDEFTEKLKKDIQRYRESAEEVGMIE